MRPRALLSLMGVLVGLLLSRPAPAAQATTPTYHVFLPLALQAPDSSADSSSALPSFDSFAASVSDGQAGVLRGVYVPGVLALEVAQQPEDNPLYIDLTPGVATQYALASNYGVTGLLADNVASGSLFFKLSPGHLVRLVIGDGAVRDYRVTTLYRFRAVEPTNPYTQFEDLDSGAMLSSLDVFKLVYMGGDHVTFQTCIAEDGIPSWGRLFVIAMPEGEG